MKPPRRRFLRAAGVTLALPWLDALAPARASGAAGRSELNSRYRPSGETMGS